MTADGGSTQGGTGGNRRDHSPSGRPDQRTQPPSVLGPCRDRGGPADDRARCIGGHRGPALGPTGAAHLRGRSPVGDERLYLGLRKPAAPRRPDRRLPGTAQDVLRRPPRVRHRLRPRWPGAELGHALRCPRPAGCLRCGHGARRPLAAHRHLHRTPRAGPGLRGLRRHRRRRRRHRARPRRDPHPVRVVAVDAADQRSHRIDHRIRGDPGHRREQGNHPLRVRHPRRGHRHRGPVPVGLRVHGCRHRGVGSTADRRHAGRSRGDPSG